MKKITVELSEKAEKSFNEIMYSLPKNPDGTGTCTQSQAVSYALECLASFEEMIGMDIPSFLDGNVRCGNGTIISSEEYDKLMEDNPPMRAGDLPAEF